MGTKTKTQVKASKKAEPVEAAQPSSKKAQKEKLKKKQLGKEALKKKRREEEEEFEDEVENVQEDDVEMQVEQDDNDDEEEKYAENQEMEEEENEEGGDDEGEEDDIPVSAMQFALMDDEDVQNQALSLLIKNRKKTVKEEQEKRRKVTEFKFRVLDLLEIYVKKIKDPAAFLPNVVRIIHIIRDENRNLLKEHLVRKLGAILKSYFEKDKELLVDYEYDISNLFAEILSVLKRAKDAKLEKILRFCLISLLQIKSKLTQNTDNFEPIKLQYRTALAEYASKKNPNITSHVFKDFINKIPAKGISLLPTLIEKLDLKESGGARSELQRNECLHMVDSILAQKEKLADDLVPLIIESEEHLEKVLNNVFGHTDQIKKKKVATLNRYFQISQNARKVLQSYKESNPEAAKKLKVTSHEKKIKEMTLAALEKLKPEAGLPENLIQKMKSKLQPSA